MRRFAQRELPEIERGDEPVGLELRRRYAELGYLGVNTPTEYGGGGLGADSPDGGDGQVDATAVEYGLKAHLAHEPVLGLQMKHGPVGHVDPTPWRTVNDRVRSRAASHQHPRKTARQKNLGIRRKGNLVLGRRPGSRGKRRMTHYLTRAELNRDAPEHALRVLSSTRTTDVP